MAFLADRRCPAAIRGPPAHHMNETGYTAELVMPRAHVLTATVLQETLDDEETGMSVSLVAP